MVRSRRPVLPVLQSLPTLHSKRIEMNRAKNLAIFCSGVITGILGVILAACAGFTYPDITIKNPPTGQTNTNSVTVPIGPQGE